MKKMFVALMFCGVALMAAPQLHAACGPSTPMIMGSAILNCLDKAPVAAFAWQLSSPTTVNSGTEKIACEAQDPANNCFADSGGLNDGRVSVETDWANPGIVGCPVVGTTNNRVVVSVQATDGTGVLLSVGGGNPAELGYLLDAAFPIDVSAGVFLPLACSSANGRPFINSITSSSIDVTIRKPRIFSDCDPDSFGFLAPTIGATAGPVCLDSFDGTGSVTLGSIYTSTQPCGTRPNLAKTAWTAAAVTPDATGRAVVPYTKPTVDTQCNFIGSTVRVLNTESNSITGFVQIQGGLAPAPQALNVRAAFANGKVNVSFDTDSELGLAAINVLTTSKGGKGEAKVGSVALQGVGGSGASYKTSFGKGDFKGGDSVIIELVTNDGRTTRSNAVRF